MRGKGVRLTFLVGLITAILMVLTGCSADLNRLLFGFVAEVRDSKGVHEFETIQAGVDYVIQRNKESGKSVSRAMEGIEEEDIVYLIRDVGEGEYGEFFRGESITVDNYGGKIGIDFQDYVYRFENDTEGGKFFSILDGSEVHIRGGHTIILANNASVEYAMIIDSPNVKLTDHWLEDRRVHRKLVDKDPEGQDVVTEWDLCNGVKVGTKGKLVVNGEKTKLGSVIEVRTGGVFEIDNCEKIKIYELIEEGGEGTGNVTIAGGTIDHPHKLGPRVETAARGHESEVKHTFIHVPSDFVYEAAEGAVSALRDDIESGSNVEIYDKVVCYCNVTPECKDATKGFVSMSLENPYDPVWRGVAKKPCHVVFDKWYESKKTDNDIVYVKNDSGAARAAGYMMFQDKMSSSGGKTYCGLEFVIEDGSGYGGIGVELPDDVKVDQNKPTGNLTFADGVVSFVKTGGDAVSQWQWNIDNGKYFVPAANEYTESSTPDSVDLVALEEAGSIEKGISHKAVLYVKNRGGQTSCSMNVYMPEGELSLTIFRTKKPNNTVASDFQNVAFVPVRHTVATSEELLTANIVSWKWTIDGKEITSASTGTVEKLNLPTLSLNRDITLAPDLDVAAGLDADKFKVGNTDMHKVELTVKYWGGRADYTYKLYTQEGLSDPVEGYKVREFTDR